MVNHFLPGLRCLRTDMEHLSPEHEVTYCDDKVTVIISCMCVCFNNSYTDFLLYMTHGYDNLLVMRS